jgi:hypothetical protein
VSDAAQDHDDEYEDDGDFMDDYDCTWCNGEAQFWGSELPGYDPGWQCPCRGTSRPAGDRRVGSNPTPSASGPDRFSRASGQREVGPAGNEGRRSGSDQAAASIDYVLFAHDYGTHLPYCEILQVATSIKCTCGFKEALEAALASEALSRVR